MNNKYGFTLLELLIAAAILGVLAIFATQSFRQSSSEVRVEDAKVRAQAIAMAARRYKIDHPGATFSGAIGAISKPGECVTDGSATLQTLVNCRYLEYRQVASEVNRVESGEGNAVSSYFDFSFKDDSSGKVCFERRSANGKILDATKYCTNGEVWD